MELGEKIRLGRRKLGLSQRALAKRIGVSPSAVAQWETGDTAPGADNLLILMSLFSAVGVRLSDGPIGSNEEELLALWREMTPDAQAHMLAMVRSVASLQASRAPTPAPGRARGGKQQPKRKPS